MLSSDDIKEQMVEARRQQILMGAAHVFAEKGYHRATTKEIAKKAGISEGTIYNYFGNKQDLLLALIDFIGVRTLRNFFEGPLPDDPREFVRRVLHDRFVIVQQYGQYIAPIMAELINNDELREEIYQKIAQPLFAFVEQYLQRQMDAGKIRQGNPLIMSRVILGSSIINIAFKLSGLDPRYDDLDPEEIFEEIIASVFEGMLIEADEHTPDSDEQP